MEDLQAKIKTLHSSIWERRAYWPHVLEWLEQFKSGPDHTTDEQIGALRLLSSFMYFGTNEIRALLRALYRDTLRPQVAKEVRSAGGCTASLGKLGPMIDSELRRTRFVPLGNPSESSTLLLYYFRQENALSKELFLHSSDIFDLSTLGTAGGVKLHYPDVTRYVFIDDLCGSGHQGKQYSDRIVGPLKRLNKDLRTYYFPIFGLSDGIDFLRTNAKFDVVYPVVELDSSFKAFSSESRLFVDPEIAKSRGSMEAMCRRYGSEIFPDHPLGYEDGQLYIGFSHNTPDNCLPIFWCDHTASKPWRAIFRRYGKIYS